MKLTGKAKEDFFNSWMKDEDDIELKEFGFDTYDYTCQNAFIIEWMDSVEVYIEIKPYTGGGSCVYYPTIIWRGFDFIDHYENIDNDYFLSRQEAIKAAIEKANEIYNSNHK